MSDIKFDGEMINIEGDANFFTIHGGNSHFGYGTQGVAYVSYGASGALIIRTFDGTSYSDKARVGGNGQVDFLTSLGGNTHFGYGAAGDGYLSFGARGALTIRTFDGSNYSDKARIGGNGQVDFFTSLGGNTHFGYGATGDDYLSFGARGTLTIRTFNGSSYSDKARIGGNGQVDLFTSLGGNTHFGYGASGDAYLSFGAGGGLIIRTFDGSNYRQRLRVGGNGQIGINNQAGQETIRLDAEAGTLTLSGTLNVGTALVQAQARIQTLETQVADLLARVAALEARPR